MNKLYITKQVNKKQVREHRYLIELKIGRKLLSNEIVHHIDGDKKNNSLDNLIIITRSEHKKLHPNIGINSRFKIKYKFSDKDIYKMRTLFKDKTLSEIAKQYSTSIGTIQRIIGKKPKVYCRCGAIANYRNKKLCLKCYLKEYYANAKLNRKDNTGRLFRGIKNI